MAVVTLRYWAAAKHAAGVTEEIIHADTLAGALAAAVSAREAAQGSAGMAGGPASLRAVLARSSFLIDGTPVGSRAADSIQLRDAAVVEVLPPFAGG